MPASAARSTLLSMNKTLVNFVPAAADLAGFVFYFLFFSSTVALMAQRTVFSAWFLILLYLAFCFGVNGIRKLIPAAEARPSLLDPLKFLLERRFLIGLALLTFGGFLAAEADLNRFGESLALLAAEPGQVNEAEVALYFAFGPAFVWTVVGLFYLLVQSSTKPPFIERSSGRYAIAEFFGLLSINLLMLTVAAYLKTLFGESTAISVLSSLLLLLLLFLPPRLQHFFKAPRLWTLIPFLVLMTASVF